MIETLAHGYSYESTRQELSNEHQHDIKLRWFSKIFVFVLCMEVKPQQW